MKSKDLPQIQQYFMEEIYTQQRLDRSIVDELYSKKHIPRTKKNDDLFLDMFSKIFNVIKSKQYLEDIRKTAFEYSDTIHKEKIMNLWNMLKNNEPLPSMITRKWIEIGFQGEDPATDFRGAGMLGLENLIYFTENHKNEALNIYKTSRTKKFEYFFAAAGLYFTLEIFHMLNDNFFDEFFYQADSKEEALAVFGEIYSAAFCMFDKFWTKRTDTSIMRFNTIILEFFAIMKKEALPELLRTAREYLT